MDTNKEKSWAELEVELASKRERGDKSEDEWGYGVACYESALKAYKSLEEDGHSGMSIGFTKTILNRLIDHKPLTPIADTDDIWRFSHDIRKNGGKSYQCKRMSSLFKDVDKDGNVTYSDNNLCYCVDINNPNLTYSSSLVRCIIHEMFPITMPYMPSDKAIKVYCEEFLTDKKNGDFDTVGVYYAIKPDGERVEINRFFKEGKHNWEEINSSEYYKRSLIASRLLQKSKEDENNA